MYMEREEAVSDVLHLHASISNGKLIGRWGTLLVGSANAVLFWLDTLR